MMIGNSRQIRGFEGVDIDMRKNKNQDIILPTRGTRFSAGYDFYSQVTFDVPVGGSYKLFTDVKAYMLEDEYLSIFIRSSIATKKNLVLANGTGIIDSDYYGNVSNDGNIIVCLKNTGNDIVHINIGEKVCQGIFLKFLTCV